MFYFFFVSWCLCFETRQCIILHFLCTPWVPTGRCKCSSTEKDTLSFTCLLFTSPIPRFIMSAAAATVSPANPGAAAVAPAVSAPSTIQQASSVAQAAVQLDHDGAAADAATLYDRAASLLRAALSNAAEAAVLSSQQQAALAAAQQSYAARADALRALAGGTCARQRKRGWVLHTPNQGSWVRMPRQQQYCCWAGPRGVHTAVNVDVIVHVLFS